MRVCVCVCVSPNNRSLNLKQMLIRYPEFEGELWLVYLICGSDFSFVVFYIL